jgi:hypothetical protein
LHRLAFLGASFLGRLTPIPRSSILKAVKRLVSLALAGLYLGLTNFCLSYAVVTGEPHHQAASSDQVSHHEHHGDHDGRTPAPKNGDASDPCCAINKPGLLAPSSPQPPARTLLAAWTVLPVALTGETVEPPVSYFGRPDHGPPKSASQEALRSRLAPRAPPALA